MNTVLLVGGILVLFFIIAKAADFLVGSLIDLSKRLRLSDFTIGFLVLGIATSSPEISIGLQTASKGVPELSFGNLIGASFVLISVVAGLSAIRNGGFSLDGLLTRRAFGIASLLILSPLVVAFDGEIGRFDGALLVSLYIAYVVTVFFQRRFVLLETIFEARKLERTITHLVLGLALLLLGSHLVVRLGEELALNLNIPLVLTGLLLFGLGTNLPELSLALRARRFGRGGMSFGNIVGSAATNSLIIGLLGILSPFTFSAPQLLLGVGAFLILGLSLFTIFTLSRNRLQPREGLVLVGVYILFLITELTLLDSAQKL